jgi:hypothetical protein
MMTGQPELSLVLSLSEPKKQQRKKGFEAFSASVDLFNSAYEYIWCVLRALRPHDFAHLTFSGD